MTNYPNSLDSELTIVPVDYTVPGSQTINGLIDAIIAVEKELGINPKGIYTSVAIRLANLEARAGGTGGGGGIGLPGETGPTGPAGPQGSPGVTGLPGIQGPQGATGLAGIQGPQGSPGVTGLRGATGLQGIQGVTGPQGLQGVTGARGATGPAGAGASPTVQNGFNYAKYIDIPVFSVTPSTALATFVTAGTFEFDMSKFTPANGTRTIVFRVIVETTAPIMSIQLYNYTANSIVAGSASTTTSTTPVLLVSPDLTSSLSPGSAIYQVQIKMGSGSINDRVTLDNAVLRIEWS